MVASGRRAKSKSGRHAPSPSSRDALQSSSLLRCRSFARGRLYERGVELFDRAAARLDPDKPESERREDVPGSEVIEGRNDRGERHLRVAVIGRAGDQGEAERVDEFSVIARPVGKTARATAPATTRSYKVQ